MRVGYLTEEQFADIIAPAINAVITDSHTHVIASVTGLQAALDAKQPLDGTLTALAGLSWIAGFQIPVFTAADTVSFRSVGAASGTDLLDRDAGDGRYAPLTHAHAIADVTGLQTALDNKLDDTQASTYGLTLLDDADAATARNTLGLTSAATATPSALSKTDDTNVTLTLGGTPGTALLQATSITVGWSGTLAVARGGTGASTASGARTSLGLGTIATQDASNVTLTGGSIDGVTTLRLVGASNPAIQVKDTANAGTSSRSRYIGVDSTGAIQYQFGKPFTGGAYYFDNTTGNNFVFSVAGSQKLLFDTTNNRFDLNSGYVVRINSTQVLGSRRTGWATATGTATRTTFDTATVTTAQLAERVKALIDDLHGTAGHGLIGT